MASLAADWGQTFRAEHHYRRCLAATTQLKGKTRLDRRASCLNGLAFLPADQGARERWDEAVTLVDRALKMHRELGKPSPAVLFTKAEILTRIGDRPKEVEVLRAQAMKAGASKQLLAFHKRWCERKRAGR